MNILSLEQRIFQALNTPLIRWFQRSTLADKRFWSLRSSFPLFDLEKIEALCNTRGYDVSDRLSQNLFYPTPRDLRDVARLESASTKEFLQTLCALHEPKKEKEDAKLLRYEYPELYASDLLLEQLQPSIRSYNALKRAGIDSVADLLSYSRSELLEIKTFGVRSLKETLAQLDWLRATQKGAKQAPRFTVPKKITFHEENGRFELILRSDCDRKVVLPLEDGCELFINADFQIQMTYPL